MSPTLDAFLRSWPLDPWLLVWVGLAAAVYLRGWQALRLQNPSRWNAGRLCAFLGGLAAIYLALASPINPFAELLLQIHMLQHLLLMMAAPPLLWLGAPLPPLLRGLPQPVRTYWVAPLLRSSSLRWLFTRLTHPAVALLVFVATTLLWHAPGAYELALRSNGWHYLQHACFLATGLLFWYPVVQPYPSRPCWSPWLLLPYLFLADLQNTVLSALLTFSNHVLYPHYLQVSRLGGLSALEDQAAAGGLMWVPGSLVFLLPLFVIGFRLLYGPQGDKETRRQGERSGVVRQAACTSAHYARLPIGLLVSLSPCLLVWFRPVARTAARSIPEMAARSARNAATAAGAGGFGWSGLGRPHWVCACCQPVADWLPRLEILMLEVGLLLSLYAGYRIALTQSPRLSQALLALAPWALLMTMLFATGIWLVFQPMQMRDTMEM